MATFCGMDASTRNKFGTTIPRPASYSPCHNYVCCKVRVITFPDFRTLTAGGSTCA
jgi:hypothetical protein